jgi:hypothetical protein
MRVEGISEDKVCGPLERRLGVLDQTPNGAIRDARSANPASLISFPIPPSFQPRVPRPLFLGYTLSVRRRVSRRAVGWVHGSTTADNSLGFLLPPVPFQRCLQMRTLRVGAGTNALICLIFPPAGSVRRAPPYSEVKAVEGKVRNRP